MSSPAPLPVLRLVQGEWFQAEDAHGVRMALRVPVILGRTSLLDYVPGDRLGQ